MKDNHLEVSGKTCCPTCGQKLPEPEPSVEILEDFFDYNLLTGFLTHKYRPMKYFKSKRSYSKFNNNMVGKRAGSPYDHLSKNGRRSISVFRKKYLEHRVIWALYYKEWPPKGMVIDHINGDPSDNRLDNLRLVTPRENAMNRKLSSNCKSGVSGIHKSVTRNSWVAVIWVGGRNLNLGTFINFDDAVKVRKAAEIKYGFHENHGRDGIVDG